MILYSIINIQRVTYRFRFVVRPTGGRRRVQPCTRDSMQGDEPDNHNDIDQRTKRARTEDMTVTLRRSGGIYTVQSESGNVYRVDVLRKGCTCPDQQKASVNRCKHLRRVDMEIQNRTVPTPDGRLPERPRADGGVKESVRGPSQAPTSGRIEGPLQELDKHGNPTGESYFRCRACGREAMRKKDLEDCCPESSQTGKKMSRNQ